MLASVWLRKTKAPGWKPTFRMYLAPATLGSPVVMLYVKSSQPAHAPDHVEGELLVSLEPQSVQLRPVTGNFGQSHRQDLVISLSAHHGHDGQTRTGEFYKSTCGGI